MKERIVWIDWAKALAVCTVVFCHLPQSQEWFYYRYLQSVIIVVFFFLSGYLKKDRGSNKENWRKYWHGLVAPYIFYNLLIYPYWLAKFYMSYHCMPDLMQALSPVIGTILLQHENSFCEPLNGPLWYLPAILIMHLMIDFSRKTKYMHHIMITLCILSFFLYAANKYWYFAPNLTPMGLMRNLPYYYIGIVFGQYRFFSNTNTRFNLIGCIMCFAASILFFYWHLDAFFSGSHMLHIILYYPVNIGFLFGVFFGCKLLGKYKSNIITNLSIGTLVIIGLHIVVVSVVNYTIESLLEIKGVVCYQWYAALPTALAIVVLLYPIIVFGKKHLPLLMGKRYSQKDTSTSA